MISTFTRSLGDCMMGANQNFYAAAHTIEAAFVLGIVFGALAPIAVEHRNHRTFWGYMSAMCATILSMSIWALIAPDDKGANWQHDQLLFFLMMFLVSLFNGAIISTIVRDKYRLKMRVVEEELMRPSKVQLALEFHEEKRKSDENYEKMQEEVRAEALRLAQIELRAERKAKEWAATKPTPNCQSGIVRKRRAKHDSEQPTPR